MAGVYAPESLGVKAPAGGFQQGGWYEGRQYWGGTLSDPGVIHPSSNQQGAGQAVSAEVNAQSAAKQGVSPQQLEAYLQQQRDKQARATGVNTAGAATMPTPGTDVNAGGFGAGVGFNAEATPAINLPDIYKSLSESAGLSGIEESLTNKSKAFNDAQSKINDNPFLSEASRTGRIAKLTTDYNASVKTDQETLAMKKADIQMQLDLQTKQFDINSQTAKMALDQFNTLLSSGALAGASGNDIAAITKATGISSPMVMSAINAQKQKDVQTSVSTVDDGKNIYSVVINSKTGEIISKQAISASKPAATSATASKEQDKLTIQSYLRKDAKSGLDLSQIFQKYGGFLDPNLIYQLYNSNSKYGADKGDIKALEKFGVKASGGGSATDALISALNQ